MHEFTEMRAPGWQVKIRNPNLQYHRQSYSLDFRNYKGASWIMERQEPCSLRQLYTGCIFELLERRGNKIVKFKYRGVWIIVDNGYHNWYVTVTPFTNYEFQHEICWSEWMESMQKDVKSSVHSGF